MRRAAVLAFACAIAPAARAESRVVVGRFATAFLHDDAHKARAFNVELAAEAIDDKTIPANGMFSFNDAVGERTAAFGFAKATVLRDGMLAEGTGGGTCQVASTLHAAALLAGLDVVSRAPHSRPSAYIRIGLDATVAFGSIDLKLKNPTSAPVVIHARAAKGSLDVWLEGTRRPDVTLTTEIVEHVLPARQIERDASLVDDKAHVRAFGIPGFRVRRTRAIRGEDGGLHRDVRVDAYPVTNEVLRVAPTFDISRLDRAGDADPANASAPALVLDAGAVRPVAVQLRPSTTVTIDNTTSRAP